MMEAVILIGIQGSGKSTFYRERFFDTHVRISLDLLKTRPRERTFLETCLATGQPFAVDNTNARTEERAIYIDAARRRAFHVTGFFFDADVKECLRRNAERTGKSRIPIVGLMATRKRLERPVPQEGFDELYVVTHDQAAAFVVRGWKQGEGVSNA